MDRRAFIGGLALETLAASEDNAVTRQMERT
jgi:hypothetical protein